MKLYPLKFQPIFKYRIWGGNKLKTVLNKDYEGENIGESWEISDVKGDATKVINGNLKGYTLQKLINEFGSDFLGKKVYDSFGKNFPLLIKFIDAKTPLSVQVHPHDSIARERHESFGKNEMWYIMDADYKSEIIVGFQKELNQDSYSKYLKDKNLLEVLNTVETQAGEAFYIPTGRVHAIGAGVLLAEIQQTSDITYRIYDYDRVDRATGKTRELHNELAKDVIDFKVYDSYKTTYSQYPNAVNTLIHSRYFKTNILILDKKYDRYYFDIESFIIFICTHGSVEITVNFKRYIVKKGHSILLPAVINHVKFLPIQECNLIEVYYE
ncbi:type I phosphomannose isomerase catalytic subunit [Polaribacter sp.]|uniref:type I phosphomannose isomerase catalytic subunit n=1 Tax=Polaribacter sp. TaxID=1920175 RepID=UPI003F698592